MSKIIAMLITVSTFFFTVNNPGKTYFNKSCL